MTLWWLVNGLDLGVQSELCSTSAYCKLNLRMFLNQQYALVLNINVNFIVGMFYTKWKTPFRKFALLP